MLTKKTILLLVALLITTFFVASCLQTAGVSMVESQRQEVIKENRKLDSLKSEIKVVQRKAQKVDQLERQKSALRSQVQSVSQEKDSLKASLILFRYNSDIRLSEKEYAVQTLNDVVESLKEDKKNVSDIADTYSQDIKKLSDSLFTANQSIKKYKQKVGVLETKLRLARKKRRILHWAYGIAITLILIFIVIALLKQNSFS